MSRTRGTGGYGGAGTDAVTVIDGAGLMVMPGMISTHAHLNGGTLATGFLEEVLDPRFQHSPDVHAQGSVLEQRRGHPGARRTDAGSGRRCATRSPS